MLYNINIKDLKVKIGSLVKLLRKKQQMSQEELAVMIGVSRMTIQKLEAGNNATIDTLLKILRQFELLQNFQNFIEDELTNNSYQSLY